MAEQPMVTWTLRLEDANTVLSIISKRPFEKVADLLMYLRSTANQQLQEFQQRQQALMQPPPEEAPPPGVKPNGLDPHPPN